MAFTIYMREWILFFLDSLKKQAHVLERKL